MTRDTAPEEVLHLPPDVEMEASFSAEELTPRVRVCPDCGFDQVDAGAGLRLPNDIGEAMAIVRCWGSTDPEGPRWCRTSFTATDPGKGEKRSFDRRKARTR